VGRLFNHVIDPAICIYECEVRAFRECQSLPKRVLASGITALGAQGLAPPVPEVPARELWARLRGADPPLVVDVREPREFRLGHVPGATLAPLPGILSGPGDLPRGRPIILACRSGRRSARAAAHLAAHGYANVSVLQGGMLAWEAASLLEAVDV
jgi:SulP family sulfate permease